jgi:type VI secretion system secreted protein VgrG
LATADQQWQEGAFMDQRLYKQASSEGTAAGSKAIQQHRVLAVNCPLGADVLLLHRMQAREQLSRLFEYRLECYSEDPGVDLDALLGQPMTVRLETPQQTTRYFNGLVSDGSRVPGRGRYASYRFTLRPWPWLLSRTSNCRIFQNQKAPDIIKQVFREGGFAEFTDLLDAGKYREREYCVQYRETDLDFVSRLMEEEGIFYYFKHEDGKHTLLLADADSAHEPVPGYETVPYFPDHNEDEREYIHDWSLSQTLQPGFVALNDFDFKLPRKPLHSRLGQKREHARADYEIYDYPGRYVEAGDGEHYARIRLQELQARHKTLGGQSNARGLAVGALLKLQHNPLDKDDTEYLISAADYQLHSDEFETRDGAGAEPLYACAFQVIEVAQPYSPPRLTPKPLVQGPQSAIVVGPSGEEIHTDEHGRVKCQFHWDRYGKADENSSCWIRVSHPWAGKGWGAVAIPRIGQEVIVDFLEGDPDQPIITGRVYNGEQKPPFPLPEGKHLSGIKSNSTKGGGGYNEFSMDDTKGKELVHIHAQHDMDTVVENDDRQTVHNNRTIKVDGTHTETIVKDTSVTVSEGNYTHKVTEGTSTRYVKGDVMEDFDATQKTYVKKGILIKSEEANIQVYAATQVLVVTGDSMLDMRSDGTIKLSGKKIEITGDEEVKIGVGNQTTTYNKQKIANSGAAINSTAVGLHEIAGALVKVN